MTKSIFSNGHTDTYKGKRPVTAGWMVVTPEGDIYSGHSLDAAKAEKTARNNASTDYSNIRASFNRNDLAYAHVYRYAAKEAAAAGFKNPKAYLADIAKRRAEFVEKCIIEITEIK